MHTPDRSQQPSARTAPATTTAEPARLGSTNSRNAPATSSRHTGHYAFVDDLFLWPTSTPPTTCNSATEAPNSASPDVEPAPTPGTQAAPLEPSVAAATAEQAAASELRPLASVDWVAGATPDFDGPQADAEQPDLELSVPLVYWMGGQDWDSEDDEDEAPDLIEVEDGMPLLYRGKSHLVFGAGGSGKSWFVLHCVAQTLSSGGKVLYIDYEMNRGQVKARLKALGVTREQAAGLAYWRVTGGFRGDQLAALGWLVGMYRFELVTLDSVSKALSTLDLDESGNKDYHRFDDTVIVPLTYRDLTVLMIDHTGNDHPVGGSLKRPRGASGKRDSVSGASYWFTVADKDAWTRSRDGKARLLVQKDRGGHRASGELAAVMHVSVHEHGKKLDISLRADPDVEQTTQNGAPQRRSLSDYADKVRGYLHHVGEASGKDITERARLGRAAAVRDALRYLLETGQIEELPGKGGGRNYRLNPHAAALDAAAGGADGQVRD